MAAIWISFSCVAIWISRCASVLRLLMARSDSMTAVSLTCLAPASFSANGVVGIDAGVLLGQTRGLGCGRDLGAGARGLVGDVALLRELGLLLGALDGQGLLPSLEVLLRNRHLVVAHDRVAVAPACLSDGLQLGQTFGVEEVFRIEEFHIRLVELGQRHRFKLETVGFYVRFHGRLHMLDEVAALLLQLQDGHGGRHRPQAVYEFCLDLVTQGFGVIRQRAQRLAGERNALIVRTDAHVELGDDVDAQAVLGDQGFPLLALDGEPQRLQVDAGVGVEDRQDHGAAVEHDLLAAEAGTHEGLVASGALVEDGEDDPEDDDQRDADHGRDCDIEHDFLR
ncbi:hypothetical protein ABIF66_007710 [Bradyrhizobium japonicum]